MVAGSRAAATRGGGAASWRFSLTASNLGDGRRVQTACGGTHVVRFRRYIGVRLRGSTARTQFRSYLCGSRVGVDDGCRVGLGWAGGGVEHGGVGLQLGDRRADQWALGGSDVGGDGDGGDPVCELAWYGGCPGRGERQPGAHGRGRV